MISFLGGVCAFFAEITAWLFKEARIYICITYKDNMIHFCAIESKWASKWVPFAICKPSSSWRIHNVLRLFAVIFSSFAACLFYDRLFQLELAIKFASYGTINGKMTEKTLRAERLKRIWDAVPSEYIEFMPLLLSLWFAIEKFVKTKLMKY